ncbi:MAG: hypothetical protein LBJ64_09490, partial [Deltaproteobacteria bacterium]|nr:hypothetical protein [Deltaproteobacteria bacterium]
MVKPICNWFYRRLVPLCRPFPRSACPKANDVYAAAVSFEPESFAGGPAPSSPLPPPRHVPVPPRKVAPSIFIFFSAFIFFNFLISGCGTVIPDIPEMMVTRQRLEEADRLLESDPKGPIPKPDMPSSAYPQEAAAAPGRTGHFPYRLEVEAPPEPKGLAEEFRKIADLETMIEETPKSMLILQRRLHSSQEQGRALLQSLGYFEGQAEGLLLPPRADARAEADSPSSAPESPLLGDKTSQDSPEPVQEKTERRRAGAKAGQPQSQPAHLARVTLIPGPLYHLEAGDLILSEDPVLMELEDDYPGEEYDEGIYQSHEEARDEHLRRALAANEAGQPKGGRFCPPEDGGPPCPAGDLQAAGLIVGAPARTADVLNMEERLTSLWRDGGYPQAEIVGTRYSIDPNQKTLLAQIVLMPGPYIKMGDLEASGDDTVKNRFLRNNVNWRQGQSWNQETADAYREILLQTGLFKAVEVAPGAAPDEAGNHPVAVRLEAAPRRTISGSLNYDSDWGPGVSVAWEHRNLSGWGDSLRIELPYWKDLVQLGLRYQRPFVFNNRNQSLLMEGYLLRETTDNYSLSSVSAAV